MLRSSTKYWKNHIQQYIKKIIDETEDGGNIGGSGVHFPSTPGKHLADLRSRANSQHIPYAGIPAYMKIGEQR